MLDTKKYLVLDYETRSEADLKAIGAYEYARHPSTKILCVSWRYGTRAELPKVKTKSWSPAFSPFGTGISAELHLHFKMSGIDRTRLVAHNALFEQVITEFVLYRDCRYEIPVERWLCTAALAAVLALPRKLEGATSALKLRHQKDMAGHKLMMKMSKPKKQTKNSKGKWHCKKKDLLRLIEYCEHDVAAEVDLLLALPPLSETERKVWELDQRTNLRGFAVDRPLVKKILGHVETELAVYDKEISSITNGVIESANKVQVMRKHLSSIGLKLPNMQAKTVQDTLERKDLGAIARRILEIRANASKTSTAKYYSMEMRSRFDGRVRDLLMYHGASTGRWTGMGVQIHNFPRGWLGESGPLAAELIGKSDLDLIRMLYGEPLDCFSSVLRSTIIATPGCEIFCGDYAAIEARKLFYMAGHDEGVKAYREGRDIYREMAQVIFGVRKLDDVTKAQREIGKRVILGCGYGMGWRKFVETCKQFGVEIDATLAKKSVDAYREVHAPVPTMWRDLETAMVSAVENPGKVFATNMTRWYKKGDFLWCDLPSGRPLAFYGPQVKMKPTPWGERKPTIYHWSVHPKTKKWVFDGTYGGRVTENVVSGGARDVLAESSLRLDDAGYPLLFSVHDELANEKEIGQGDLGEYTKLMSIVPTWAPGFPLKVETWKGPRYRK